MKLELSIIIPCYNCEKTLREAVDSCFVQGLDNFEIVMVDDGSRDGTRELMQKLANEHKEIKIFYHEKNKGGGATRNTAVKKSQADIIFCLDSDDILPRDTMSKMLSFMKEKNCDGVGIHKSIKFSGTNINNVSYINIFGYVDEIIPLESLLKKEDPFCSLYSTFMFTKKAFQIAGGYPTEHGFDTQGFAWRFLSHGLIAYTCPDATYLHRVNFHESYYLREANGGKINYNWRDIFIEHLALFDRDTQEFIKNFNCKDFSKDFFEELKKRDKIFADNYKEIIGPSFPKTEIPNVPRIYIKKNSLLGILIRIKVKVKKLIKRNDFLFLTASFILAFGQRIKKLFTEIDERRKYYEQIEQIKRHKKIVLDIEFGGLGDWLVYTSLPRLLKEKYDVDFYLSKQSLEKVRNKDIYKICFEMNPYFRGVSNDKSFRVKSFICEKSIINFLFDVKGEGLVEMCERQFNVTDKNIPEIYYQPKKIEGHQNVILVDKNYISGIKLGWKYSEESFEREIKKLLKNSQNYKVEYVDPSKQNLFQYVDMICSCAQFITVLSGGAALASCFKKPFIVLLPYNIVGGGVDQFMFRKSVATYVK